MHSEVGINRSTKSKTGHTKASHGPKDDFQTCKPPPQPGVVKLCPLGGGDGRDLAQGCYRRCPQQAAAAKSPGWGETGTAANSQQTLWPSGAGTGPCPHHPNLQN